MVDYRFLMRQTEYNRPMIKIIIDMDDQTYGFPAFISGQNPKFHFGGNLATSSFMFK